MCIYFVSNIHNCSYGAQASTLGGLLPCYSYCTQRLTHLNDDQRAKQSKAGGGKMDNKQLWQQTNWVPACLLFTATVTSLTHTLIEKLRSKCAKTYKLTHCLQKQLHSQEKCYFWHNDISTQCNQTSSMKITKNKTQCRLGKRLAG